ncbi:hypothetical protein B0A52_05044 [Exophiala mesophila]|uniref:Xylanolytic transcriptional activator regulatory domain-containing protein n=1 Tax=Exophiala mesophila TaxID=212818 RepID=A0A438N6V6_EXOME|nr:hypothetical protein B0A52_05044 [Exophiala mesophila]
MVRVGGTSSQDQSSIASTPRRTYSTISQSHSPGQHHPDYGQPARHTEVAQVSALQSHRKQIGEKTVEALHVDKNLEQITTGGQTLTFLPLSSSFAAGARLSDDEKLELNIYLTASLPSRSQCDLCVSWYLDHINFIYQSIHASSFRQQYSALWTTTVAKVDLVWLALLYVMISLSTMFMDTDLCAMLDMDPAQFRQSTHRWFRLSRQALHAAEYEARPCLTQLLVFQQSQLYWYAIKNVESLNSALGQAIQCARALGLDKDKAPSKNLESEMRHRIWWDICCDDIYQSLCLDRRPLIQSHLSDVPFPLNCDDCDLTPTSVSSRPMDHPTVMTVHVFRARIFKVLNTLYADNGIKTSSYETVESIDNEILAIIDQFPWYLLPQSPSSPTFVSTTLPPYYDYLQWQHHLVHNSVSVQRIRMFRPFLRTHFERCWSRCISAAEGAFAVYNCMRVVDPVRFRTSKKKLSQAYQLFCSAVSTAIFLLVERPILPAKILSDIELVIQDMKELSEDKNSAPIAVDGREALIKILEAYQGYRRDANSTRAALAESAADDSQQLNTVMPDLSIVMGGRASAKDYLETCLTPRVARSEPHSQPNRQVAPSLTTVVALNDVTLTSPTDSMSGTFMTPAGDSYAPDSAMGLNLGLHFDILGWDHEETSFLNGLFS